MEKIFSFSHFYLPCFSVLNHTYCYFFRRLNQHNILLQRDGYVLRNIGPTSQEVFHVSSEVALKVARQREIPMNELLESMYVFSLKYLLFVLFSLPLMREWPTPMQIIHYRGRVKFQTQFLEKSFYVSFFVLFFSIANSCIVLNGQIAFAVQQ